MKIRAGVSALILAFGFSAALPAVAQDRDNDRRDPQVQQENRRDNDRDRVQNNEQNRDESSYYNNRYYRQGWKNASSTSARTANGKTTPTGKPMRRDTLMAIAASSGSRTRTAVTEPLTMTGTIITTGTITK